jgi:DNA-binding CsgD family transcriptional regulator
MNMLREALLLLRQSRGKKERGLQARLFAFFALFSAALVGAALIVMTLAGAFGVAGQRHVAWLESETGHLQDSVANDFGKLSLRGVAFANALSESIGAWAQENGIQGTETAASPELIEKLLSAQADTLLDTLDNNVCSGVFLILEPPGASPGSGKRAGLYFKRTETNNLTVVESKTHCLRGPASVARENGIELMGQWRMDFDISGMRVYGKALDSARQNSGVDLSRNYYWSSRYLLDGDSEHGMMLCVPLVSREGTVYGLCGMNVSAMLFKRQYIPAGVRFPRVFAALATADGESLNTGEGMMAGNSYMSSSTNGLLRHEGTRGGLSAWRSEEGELFVGRAQPLRLYPESSPFSGEKWALAVLIPATDWDSVAREGRLMLYGALAALLAFSVLAAVFVSRRYIRPVAAALELMATDNRNNLEKTQITEIDDLLEHLRAMDEKHRTLDEEKESLAAELEEARRLAEQQGASATASPVSVAYAQFLKNLETLTASERTVFDKYMDGLSAAEIAKALFISPRTVKYHNSHIYEKLGVSSLKELKLYVNTIREFYDAPRKG